MNCSDETLRQSSAASGNSPLASPNHSNNNSSNSNNSNSHGNQTVKVLVRARPGCDGTSAEHDIRVDEASSTVTFPRDKKGQAQFAFSKVLGPDADQATVYAQCEVVRDVIDGYNCCVMAYGQTGSGKTHTMYGVGWEGTQALTATAADAGLSLGRSMTFPLVPSADDEANPALPTVAPAARDSTLASTEESAGKDELSPWNAPQTVEESTLLGVVPRSISDLFVLLDERAGDNSKKFEYSIRKL